MSDHVTPIFAQWERIKAQYPDALVLFRLGDFYEAFESDAARWAEVCNLDLTKRTIGWDKRNRSRHQVLMCGAPYHVIEDYVRTLLAAGETVAIVEQLGEPVMGLVPREVAQVLAPGASF